MSEFDLKKALAGISSRYTDKDRKEQDRLNRVGRNLLDQKLAQNRIALAQAQMVSVMDNIRAAESIEDPERKKNVLFTLTDRVSELLAEQGQYREAANTTPNDARREWFQKIADAIETPADKRCDCADEIIADRRRGTNIRQRPFRTVMQVIDPVSMRLVPLRMCDKCGFANTA